MDASLSSGLDAMFVDQVVLSPGGTAPSISGQPSDRTAQPATPLILTVGAVGTPPLKYQWLLNGSVVPGATSSVLTLPSITPADGGTYRVLVSNAYGSVTSSNAVLTVVPILARGDDSFGQIEVPLRTTNAVAIAAGAWHNLALRRDGVIVAWGENYDGQCDVPAGLLASAIAAGGYHSLALRRDRTVAGWGANYSGQCTMPPGLSNVTALAAGTWHSLALRANGTVVAWGDDTFGQIDVPADLANVVAIAAAGNHSAALRANGTIATWGENTDANGSFAGESIPPYGLPSLASIGAGDYHTLAATATGSVRAWGDNSQGQCQIPANLTNVLALAGGAGHTLALKADGSAIAWGNNWDGECSIPAGLSNVVAIAAGNSHSLLLLAQAPAPLLLLNPARKAGQFTVWVQTTYGRNYTLQYKTSVHSTVWVNLPTVSGTGALEKLVDPSSADAQRFYRVRQW